MHLKTRHDYDKKGAIFALFESKGRLDKSADPIKLWSEVSYQDDV